VGDCGPTEDLERARQCLEARALETRRFFNAIAPDWRAMRREVLGALDLDGLILTLLPRSAKAVDLGCGPGDLLEAMAARADDLIGVDASPAMLELARRKPGLARASLRVGELEHLPLADAEVQAAVLSLTLHHLSDPAAALAEARRVVAPGGVLVVADYLKHQGEHMRQRYGDRWLGFTEEEMTRWLGDAGLVLETMDRKPVNLGLMLGVYLARRPLPEETK